MEINVVDDHKGILVATLKVKGDEVSCSVADAVKFQNSYKAAATEIVIKGTETLDNFNVV